MWKNKEFVTTPAKALRKSHLYTQPVHSEKRFDNAIENFFSKSVESKWPHLVNIILQKKFITQSEWSDILRFLMSMRVRVPNTIDAVTELLRASIIKVSDNVGENLDEIVEIFLKKNPDFGRRPKFFDLVEAGFVNVNIDPHTSIISLPHLVRSIEFFSLDIGAPYFLHNETRVPFISSDNPAIYHIYERDRTILSFKKEIRRTDISNKFRCSSYSENFESKKIST